MVVVRRPHLEPDCRPRKVSTDRPPAPTDASTADRPIVCRGVRGAVTIDHDDRDEVLRATRQMLALIVRRNGIEKCDIASATFTVTRDVQSEFPALAARQLGWIEVPLLCGYEISVPGSLPRCIRVLIHWNTDRSQSEVQHVYLRDAQRLRPDLEPLPAVDLEELEAWIADQMGTEV